jgi:hypothetical protein
VSTGDTAYRLGTSALIQGTVNPNGTETSCYFQYGTTTAYGSQTPSVAVGAGTSAVKVGRPISGLTPNVTYHYRLVATNSTGETVDGRDRTFTPSGIKLTLSLSTSSATVAPKGKFTVSGVLSGTGNANHEVVLQADPFPYAGNYTALGAPGYTNAAGRFSLPVSGLTQNTHLRVVTLDTLPSYSPTITERVEVGLTLRVLPTKRMGYVRFTGTVTPAQVGKTVKFQWLRPGGRHPSSVGSTVIKRGPGGVSRFTSGVVFIRHGHGGVYRAQVKLTRGAQVTGYSRSVLVHSAPAPVQVQVRHVRSGRLG